MKVKLTILIVITIFTSACSTPVHTNINGSNECIPPLNNIAYPVVTPQVTDAAPARQIPPQGNWFIQDELPFPQDELSYVGIRPSQDELWFKVPSQNKIYRYFIDNHQWKSYLASGLSLSVPDNLFIGSDNTVWAAGIQFEGSGVAGESRPLLSRFNNDTDRFDYVEDVSGLLESPQVRLTSNIVEDQSGLLWFFIENSDYVLVSFDVRTKQSQPHKQFTFTGGNSNLAIGQDGSIWFRNFTNATIVRFIPQTQEIHLFNAYPEESASIKMPPGFDKVNIFIDHSERLWFANYAWLDLSKKNSPEWYRVIDSPVFLTDKKMPDSQYSLANQFSTFQSSNGWYWFTGENGIVRLDFQQGSWCLITTGFSNVVEDDNKNIWIAVFGHLYTYSLLKGNQ